MAITLTSPTTTTTTIVETTTVKNPPPLTPHHPCTTSLTNHHHISQRPTCSTSLTSHTCPLTSIVTPSTTVTHHRMLPVTQPPVPNATVHPHQPNFPSVHHVSHQVPNNTAPILSNKPTFRVVTKAAPNYSLTIRRGEVVLAHSDPCDAFQHWYKDEKYRSRVKDSEGCPAFSLVNKVTNEAIQHSIGATHPVRLVPYDPDYLDESILWTESRDLGDSYRAIRMANNIDLNVDASQGDKDSGGVHDGTTIILWEWNQGDNQRWKILPYCS